MKHAFLILAHNEFGALQRLLDALDVFDNYVFVHIDKKVTQIPELAMRNARLQVLSNRIKTYWGDISLIEAEFELMKEANNYGPFDYYHIISGTHFLIVSQKTFELRYNSFGGKSVFQPAEIFPGEIRMKMGKYHFFIKKQGSFKNILWRLLLKIQDFLPSRDISHINRKASQWCSLTQNDVTKLLENDKKLLRLFRRTFCCDEFFMPAALSILGIDAFWYDKLLYVDFYKANPKVLKLVDFDDIMGSDCIFARKFSKDSFALIDKICQYTHI